MSHLSHLILTIEYRWAGLEELCLPQADKVMAALLDTDDREPRHANRPKVNMDIVVESSRYEGPENRDTGFTSRDDLREFYAPIGEETT